MIPELGHFSLILALCLALLQATIPLYGAARHDTAFMQLSKYTARAQLLFAGLAFLALTWSFIVNDYSLIYVANNSNEQLPLLYRMGAVWGAHEGSLLLWVCILSFWGALVSIFNRGLPPEFVARVLAVMAMVAVGFYGFLLLTSNPFLRMLPNIPLHGRDLNPILQDPGLTLHPPMLYMGYVGFSVAFAFAMAALLSGRIETPWARWTRPWTLVAWCFLTLGIVLGSWWAYRELGWGGFWFWDPVENASFLPWLVGTALIHSLAVTEKRQVFQAWTVLLAVCVFALSLLGTFLVRSGVLISVHAFANDPRRGLYLLQFLLLVVGGAFTLYAWRGRRIVQSGHFSVWSRESLLLANNVILFVSMLTVLLGTLYPLLMDVMHLGKLSVGAPYFNTVLIPMMLPLLLIMGIAPHLQWRTTSNKKLKRELIIVLVFVLMSAVILPWVFDKPLTLFVVLGLSVALWVIVQTGLYMREPQRRRAHWAMAMAHIGIAITVIGLVLSTSYNQQLNLSMQVGERVSLAGYQFRLLQVQPVRGPNYTAWQGSMMVSRDRRMLTILHPQQRQFNVQKTVIAKSAIDVGLFRDLYVAIGKPLGHNRWAVRIYYKPFVRWIWFGGLLMVVGGVIALFSRRRKGVTQHVA